MSKTTPDLSALISRKGSAGATRPSAPPPPAATPEPTPAPVAAAVAPARAQESIKGPKVSVPFDAARYRTLRLLAVDENLTHGELMLKAFDEYVARRSRGQ